MRRHKTLNKLKPLVSARGAHTQSLQVGPSTSSLSPGAPEARLARRRLAWRAGGSPWSALPFKTTSYRSLPSQGQSISTHKSTSSHFGQRPVRSSVVSSPTPLVRNNIARPVNAPHTHAHEDLTRTLAAFCEVALSVRIVFIPSNLASRPICQEAPWQTCNCPLQTLAVETTACSSYAEYPANRSLWSP